MNALLRNIPASQFSIVGFPSNQFGHQEPGDNATEILNGLRYVRPGGGFEPHPDMHMMLKCDVNGPDEIPLYAYLKASCPQPRTAEFHPRENFWEPIKASDVEWNFEKFLVSPDGVPLFRFRAMVEPIDLKKLFIALLSPVEDLAAQRREVGKILKDLDGEIKKREEAADEES
ncbi:epididymal secretory glutathione peroxidase [Aplysia californica]|uniref:Glutathione peroxidase n=1 Tax=Aplysia californica TaxID=6500 RepID=A0ABM1A490_APLCA|nr:epididymal secretory glutathione peroxidase [Aplysia californica]